MKFEEDKFHKAKIIALDIRDSSSSISDNAQTLYDYIVGLEAEIIRLTIISNNFDEYRKIAISNGIDFAEHWLKSLQKLSGVNTNTYEELEAENKRLREALEQSIRVKEMNKTFTLEEINLIFTGI